MPPDAALVICRFLHAASLMVLWGGSAYLAWLVPAGLASIVARLFRRPAVAAVCIAIATGIAILPAETAEIGAGWGDAIDPGSLAAVLSGTGFGRAWQWQVASLLLVAASLFISGRLRLPILAFVCGLALASLAFTGHAVMQDGVSRGVHMAIDASHLLSGGAWLGALFALVPILVRLRDPALRQEASVALRRFSTAGHIAVALVILSGLSNTLLVLGHLPTDWSSPYQALLAAKIAVVAVMTILAILNRYVFVPRLARRQSGMLEVIHWASVIEILLGIAAIACVAVFGTLDPT